MLRDPLDAAPQSQMPMLPDAILSWGSGSGISPSSVGPADCPQHLSCEGYRWLGTVGLNDVLHIPI